jgi:probable F420-dependent oxidoreductase
LDDSIFVASGTPGISLKALSVVLGLWQDREPLEALETARIADALGYPSLWVGEMATFDAFVLAAGIATRTSRIALTVGPLAVGVRDPMALAMGVASVAAIGGRPAHLAIGASSPVVVERWHGRPWRRTATHLRETAEAVRPLLAGERGEFEGELVRTHGYRLRLPRPESSLTIAAFGDAAVRVAARHADRMVINLCTPELAGRLRARLDQHAADAGVEPPPLAAWIPACVDPGEEAIAQLSRGAVAYLAAPGYGEMFSAAGFEELVARAREGTAPRELLKDVPAELCRAIGLVGSETEVRERAALYRAAGVDEIAVVPATAGDPGGRRTLEAMSPVSPSA